MSRFEKKFGGHAIRNLSLKLVVLYIIGYIIEFSGRALPVSILGYMTLDPWAIVHGQVWRLISWLLIPPQSAGAGAGDLFFVAVMLFFYYSIGTALERVWGDYRYNVFILRGLLLTVVSAFLWMGFILIYYRGTDSAVFAQYFASQSVVFSTYYINMSIFLGYALTFPDAVVLLMFILPVKVKYLGVLDVLLLGYSFLTSGSAGRFMIAAALLNVLLLYLIRARGWSASPREFSRRQEFRRKVSQAERRSADQPLHRCCICGRTEKTNPELEFRYCTQCEGELEYCSDHLYGHEHVKRGEVPHMRPGAPSGRQQQ